MDKTRIGIKKLMLLLSACVVAYLFTGCSNPTVPEGREEDLSQYTVNDSENVLLEGYIHAQHRGDNMVPVDTFKSFTSIVIAGVPIQLLETTVSDILSSGDFQCQWQDTLNCFRISSDSMGSVSLLCSVDDAKDEHAVISGLSLSGLLSSDVPFSFFGIHENHSLEEVISILGDASSFATSDMTSNYQWIWRNDSTQQKASYRMIWYDNRLSQIDLQLD